MSGAKQKALVVTEVGKPMVLNSSWPIPQPGPSQLQLKVTVAGLNPFEQKGRDLGLHITNQIPAVLGMDVVGRVTVVGSAVSGFSVGDRVATQAAFTPDSAQNSLQQYSVCDAVVSMVIPDCISDDEAATLPSNTMAPLVALFDPEALALPPPWSDEASSFDYKGTPILIVGGGSNCGRFGIQIAALSGFGTILVVGGDETEVRGYGATHFIDRHGTEDEILAAIRDVVGDDLIYALDSINRHEGQHLAINALSSTKKGTLARLRPTGEPVESKIRPKKAGYVVKNVFGLSGEKLDVTKPFWERLPGYLKDGKIKATPYVTEIGLDADTVNEICDKYKAGKKVVKTGIHIE